VLARGHLSHLDDAAIERTKDELDPQPWLSGRDAWLVVRPAQITGRRLRANDIEWAFHIGGYL
jgi:hypothetical protein